MSFVNKLPVVTLLGINDIPSGTSPLAQIAAAWDGESPLFVAAGIESFTASLTPTGVKSITDALGAHFEVLRGDTFFELLRSTERSETERS